MYKYMENASIGICNMVVAQKDATIWTNELRWISIISTEDSKQQCANQSDMLHVSFNCFRSHDYICLFGIYVLKVPDTFSFSIFC